jgi:hypothetical protein
LRRDYFANGFFPNLDVAMKQANAGLAQMKANRAALRSLTCWPWIISILKAT